MAAKRTKMSKSRGNVITIDEVVYGVAGFFAGGYEFRNADGEFCDYRQWGIWRNRAGDSFYYSSTPTGRQPMFLCQCGVAQPCILLINGEEKEQHPGLYRGKQ